MGTRYKIFENAVAKEYQCTVINDLIPFSLQKHRLEAAMYILFKCVRILGAFENLEATLYLYYFAQKIIKSDIWD